MFLSHIFSDGPEYKKRIQTPFKPTKLTLAEVRAAVPKHLYRRDTSKAIFHVCRHLLFMFALFQLGTHIEPLSALLGRTLGVRGAATLSKWTLWAFYWHWQGVFLTGFWTFAHDAGHGNLSDNVWINDGIGFILHTAMLAPFYAWRATHRSHHQGTASVERDENYVPRTRSEYHLPPSNVAKLEDYAELFEDAPLYSLLRILIMQVFGWNLYLVMDHSGNARHPKPTSHFLPSSSLFRDRDRKGIFASDIGLLAMSYLLYHCYLRIGFSSLAKLYFIPYVLCNHWVVLLTYLHHSDPSVAYYRRKEWSFLRGALSTVDRPLLGWVGRFFLHNVSHDHLAHHMFSTIPFYNLPEVTEAIRTVLKDDYNFDSTNTLKALHRSFTQCCFIEDEGDIVFYKNGRGQPARVLADDYGKEEGSECAKSD